MFRFEFMCLVFPSEFSYLFRLHIDSYSSYGDTNSSLNENVGAQWEQIAIKSRYSAEKCVYIWHNIYLQAPYSIKHNGQLWFAFIMIRTHAYARVHWITLGYVLHVPTYRLAYTQFIQSCMILFGDTIEWSETTSVRKTTAIFWKCARNGAAYTNCNQNSLIAIFIAFCYTRNKDTLNTNKQLHNQRDGLHMMRLQKFDWTADWSASVLLRAP